VTVNRADEGNREIARNRQGNGRHIGVRPDDDRLPGNWFHALDRVVYVVLSAVVVSNLKRLPTKLRNTGYNYAAVVQ